MDIFGDEANTGGEGGLVECFVPYGVEVWTGIEEVFGIDLVGRHSWSDFLADEFEKRRVE